jgi:cytochrome P450
VFVPPCPEIPERGLAWFETLAALRTNVLSLWPRAAYREETLIIRLFGRRHFLFNNAEAIRRVLVDNLANYRRPPATLRVLRPIVGDGLLLSEGTEWQNQRRIIAPALANRLAPVLARHIASVAFEVVARLAASIEGPVDLLAEMQELALEIASRSMFSLEMRRHGPALRALISRYRPRLGQPTPLDVILPPAIPTIRDLARMKFRSAWIELMDAIVAQRFELLADDTPRDLFDLLTAARDPDTGAGFSRVQLRDQVATMIVAGHETTALALFWSLFLLASVPDEQERIAQEVREVDFAPGSASEALERLPFTRAVVSEALRLYPPAFIIARQAVEADCCGTTQIPAGALIVISPWVLHRHVRRWDHPEIFDPTRFLRGKPPERFAFVPFGAGPRVCVGAQLALTEVILVLAILVQNFEFCLADPRPVIPAAIVSMQPNYSVPFHLRAR